MIPPALKPDQLIQMDCITCHNRTAHLIDSPQNTVDDLLARGLLSTKIPEIKKKAVEVIGAKYSTEAEALTAIDGLVSYYQSQKADFYAANSALVNDGVKALKQVYQQTNFFDQKMNWETHPNNLAHKESPGCMRCHDGKHMEASESGDGVTAGRGTIRLECNLCHSVPVVSAPNKLTASLQLNKGFEPESHQNPNWIGLHKDLFTEACAGCHTTEDAGGVSNTSFCSNSVCHGADWKFAGFDAPKVRLLLEEQVKSMITPTQTPSPTPTSTPTLKPSPTELTRSHRPPLTQRRPHRQKDPAGPAPTATAAVSEPLRLPQQQAPRR